MSEKKWYLTTTYEEAKNIIAVNLQDMSRKFVAIGFYLKHVRDNKMYLQDGYKDIWEFAEDLYGIKRSAASRWMAINDKFSVDGNSPILLEQYKNFGKSQLQEMLYLPDDKLEQVTEDMTVKEIREIRETEKNIQEAEEEQLSILGYPKRIYPEGSLIATPGCGTYTCFSCHHSGCNIRQEYCHCVEAPLANPFSCIVLNVVESIQADVGSVCPFVNKDLAEHRQGDGQPVPCCKNCNNPCRYECSRAREKRFADKKLKEESKKDRKEELCATSHKLEESGCPPEQSDCMRQEWGTSPEQQEIGRKECKKCWSIWKRLHEAIQEPVMDAEYKELPPEQIPRQLDISEYDGVVPEYNEVAPNDFTNSGKMEETVLKHTESVSKCEESVSNNEETILSKKHVSRITPQSVLEEHKKLLNDWLETFENDDVPEFVEKQKIVVAALASMVSDLELEETKTEILEQTQPEFPDMRNNDQRKAFLNTYQTWPIWFEVPEASETYHRFDLPDGSSIVICEYHMYLEWKERYTNENPHSVGKRLYLLKPGYHYLHDCMTNETALIEHLKGLRK